MGTPLATLADAAFGADPGRWPLPSGPLPSGPLPSGAVVDGLWLRAVAAGGQGRYASARTDLTSLLRQTSCPRTEALALSTQASFLRQLGWHRRAAGLDGRAAARAGADAESAVDALAGLAADALGVGRLACSAALLGRARELHRRADTPPPRLAIRLAWVGAELAMAAADGPAAVRHATGAVELADEALPALRRHRVKSDVVLAAALCCAGDTGGSRRIAESALDQTLQHHLVPLRWAVSCLLADIGSDAHSPAEIGAARDTAAAFITRHGGRWNRGSPPSADIV